MDEDDEFGDLYSDVLPPFQPPPPPPLRSIDLNLRSHEQDASEPNSPSVARVYDTTASKPSTTPSHDAIGDDKDMNFDIEEPYAADSTPAIPGLASAAGQVRPPANLGPMAGRGRGDWRPMGMRNASAAQKGYHQTWGGNTAGRGLDFTLPSHKTIFEFDIDAFEEKPWRYQGVDITDYFNFGLNEETWKDYCKQLDQHRIETTMKSRIRVYESGRTDQGYDPDLPPELAAATGAQVVPVHSSNLVKLDTAQGDSANIRPPLPPGRPIPVETGSVERPSSIDTRAPRMRDLEAIIEIVCEDSHEDEPSGENGAEQADSGQSFRSSSPVGDRGTRSSSVDREDVGGEAGKDSEIEKEEHKMSSAVPRSAVEEDDGGGSKTERSSESSKARCGSHRDHQQLKDSAEEEVIQDRNHCTRPASNKKHHVNNAQHQSRKYQDIGKEMERTRAGSKGESGEDFDKRKERDVDGGVWRRREDDTFSRRVGDEGSRQRDRGDDHVPSRNHVDDGGLRNNYELDDHISKRRKVEEYVRRTRSEKNKISFGQREESISRLKRERGDRLDYQKRDVQHKIRDDIYDHASLRHRDDFYMQRDGNERLRERGDLDKLKLTHEDGLSAPGRERQVAARGHRGSEDRSSSRMKDEYKEHLTKYTTRQTKQTKKREYPGEESSSYHRGHGDDIVSNEKKTRLERTSAKSDKVVESLDGQRLQDRNHKDSRRKINEQREDTDSLRNKQGEQNGSSQVTVCLISL
ncbi:hypothetical protein DY000_02001155 [Brassica cretica]|uniref:Pre-mRNA polyadenylation factor Fip1 domain-containing protein n=1 Tax=Brassica cretica TaxID=69181 RepID=A0ABQ7BVN7_BRACR|nr:hypothetical protein DY000_02001155 [Brassica cretica]